jgi:cytochrome P450
LGPTFTLNLPTSPDHVYTSVPGLVTQVFSSSSDVLAAGQSNGIFAPFMGPNSVLVLDGQAHRRQRQLLMPPLGPGRVAAYVDAFHAAALRHLAAWRDDQVHAVAPLAQAITLDVMMETVFGVGGDDELAGRLAAVVQASAKPFLLLPFNQVDLGPWSPWGRFLRLRDRVYNDLQGLIDRCRSRTDPDRTDLLSLLINATHSDGTPMGDDALRDELVTILVTGHETSAMALCWVVHLLMAHPEVLRDVQAEVDAAGPTGRLPLLDAVIAETLRLHPVVPGVGRMVVKPLALGPWTLQPGRILTCSTWLSHRDPDVWSEPDRFDPSRFLEGLPRPGIYYPFGGGNRRCLGEHFARAELRVVLATLFGEWVPSAVGPKVRSVRRSITMGPSGGLTVRVKRRTAGSL